MPEFEIEQIGQPKKGTSQKTGKPWTVHSLKLKDREEEGGWVSCYWNKQEEPAVGMKLTGDIAKAKFGDGWELNTERPGGQYGAKKPYMGGGFDLGLSAGNGAVAAAARLLAGTLDPSKKADIEKFKACAQEIYVWLRLRSDNRMSHEQRKKIFALVAEKEKSDDYVQEIRDKDRDGLISKNDASKLIEQLEAE